MTRKHARTIELTHFFSFFPRRFLRRVFSLIRAVDAAATKRPFSAIRSISITRA